MIENGYIIQKLKDIKKMTEGWEWDKRLMDDNTLLERRFTNIGIALDNLRYRIEGCSQDE